MSTERLMFGVASEGAQAFVLEMDQLGDAYDKVAAKAERASRRASLGADEFRGGLHRLNQQLSASALSGQSVANAFKGLAKGGAVIVGALGGVAALAAGLVKFSEAGNEAIRVANAFTGNINALRSSSAGMIDDTSLQKLDQMREKIGLTHKEYEGLLKLATAKKATGLAESPLETVTAYLAGEEEAARKTGEIIDKTTASFKGLSEAQQKLEVTRELARRGNAIDLEQLDQSTLKHAQLETQIANLVGDLQVLAAEFLEQTGLLDMLKEALGAVSKFVSENKEEIKKLADAVVRILMKSLDIWLPAMESGADLLETVADLVVLAADAFEILAPMIDLVVNPLQLLNGAWAGLVDGIYGLLATSSPTASYGQLVEGVLRDIETQARRTAGALREVTYAAPNVGEATENHLFQMFRSSAESAASMGVDPGLVLAGRVRQAAGGDFIKAYSILEQMQDLADSSPHIQQHIINDAMDALAAAQRNIDDAASSTNKKIEQQKTLLEKLGLSAEFAGQAMLTAFTTPQRPLDRLLAHFDPERIAEQQRLQEEAAAMLRGFGAFGSAVAPGMQAAGGAALDTIGTMTRMGQSENRAAAMFEPAREVIADFRSEVQAANDDFEELRSHFTGERANELGAGLLAIADAMETFTLSLAESADEMITAFQAVEAGTMSASQAAMVGVGATLKASQQVAGGLVKDKRHLAGINALFEVAQAAAAFARWDPVTGGLHLFAAAKFGLLAGNAAGTQRGAGPARGAGRAAGNVGGAVASPLRAPPGLGDMRGERGGSSVHYHIHALDHRSAYEMVVDSLNRGAKRRDGRALDARLVGSANGRREAFAA